MEFKDIDIDTLMDMPFDEFINFPHQEYINVIDNKVSLNNDLFDFISTIDYNDFMNMDFEEFSNIIDNSLDFTCKEKLNDYTEDKNITNAYIEKYNKTCITNFCKMPKFKDNLCKFHYKQILTNVCNIDRCKNIIFKNNACYKHYVSKCTYKNCKRLTFDDKYLCKSHNELYKDICSFRKCKLDRMKHYDKCSKHANI
jgi:hypothetical protein